MKKKRSSEATVKQILEVSERLFLTYGYENTSLQNIIDELEGLTKGAIYHHFKSKEAILNAINEKILYENSPFLLVKEYKDLNGREKIRKAFLISLENKEQQYINKMLIQKTNSPKLIYEMIETNKKVLAPQLLELINEGLDDKSIQTEFPKEMSEVIMLLVNIWLLSHIYPVSDTELKRKIEFISTMTKNMGADFIDDILKEKLIGVLSSLNSLSE